MNDKSCGNNGKISVLFLVVRGAREWCEVENWKKPENVIAIFTALIRIWAS